MEGDRIGRGVRDHRWLLALVGLLVLGAALRLFGVLTFALEQDELYTYFESRDLFATALEPGIDARPFYYLFQHVLLWMLPPTTFVLRLAPLVFGIAGIVATWWVARRLFGSVAGIVSLTAIVLSPWHLYISGMARYWALIYLLALGFYYLLLRAYEHGETRHLLGALVALVLGSATHPSFIFAAVGATLGVHLIRDEGRPGWRWPPKRAWLFLWGPFLVFLVAAALALRATGSESAVRNWGSRGWLAAARLIPAMVEWATPVVAVAAALGVLYVLFARREAVQRRWAAAALLGTLSTVLLLGTAAGITSVYAEYATAMLPLVFISVGALAQLAADRMASGRGPYAAAVAVVVAAGALPSVASHLSDGTRFDYRPAFEHVRQNEPDLPVVTWPLVLQQHYAPDLDGLELKVREPYLDSLLVAHDDMWLVASLRRYGYSWDDSGIFPGWLREHCILAHSHEEPRFDFRRYRVELYRCASEPEPRD